MLRGSREKYLEAGQVLAEVQRRNDAAYELNRNWPRDEDGNLTRGSRFSPVWLTPVLLSPLIALAPGLFENLVSASTGVELGTIPTQILTTLLLPSLVLRIFKEGKHERTSATIATIFMVITISAMKEVDYSPVLSALFSSGN